MTVTHNFIVGTSTQYSKSLFFEWLKNTANVYVGLGRSEPLWGFATMNKITHATYPVTGTCDTDTTNKLIDSTADFVTDGIAVGDIVYNETDGTSGFVKTVDNLTTLSIMDSGSVDLDLFPDGDESYSIETRSWSKDVMGDDTSAAVSPRSNDDRYYDKNTDDILTGGNAAGEDEVFIAYIDNTADATVIGNYTFITEGSNGLGTLTLLHMNEHWSMVKGLNSDYMEETLIANPIASYDYYMFNFSKHVDSRSKIEELDAVLKPSIRTPIQLMYSVQPNATEPSTAFDSAIIGDLYRNINIYGEIYISGIKPEFITDGAGYIENNSLTQATFFITDADGVILQEGLTYNSAVEATDEISLIFNYSVVDEAIPDSGRLIFQSTGPSDKLAMFYERFSDGQDVSDITPAPLSLDMLKTSAFQSSVMEVLGMKKVTSANINFARRIVSEADRTTLLAIPSVQEVNIITTQIGNDEETEVDYAVTSDLEDARNNHFEYVLLDVEIDGGVGGEITEDVYRELFVCVNPLDEDDTLLTASTAVHDDLFNESDHQYNLGTILYIARKEPVYRKYLQSTEIFKLLV